MFPEFLSLYLLKSMSILP